ncbi:MAG: endonuclease/exonuclease/phosphatase family protein [Candidatus Curtissbacteria bacterium]|nr:endonuclease/exonuclease/phosphatase family protein [Candidatus Curtissbacteria bacterium]
MTLKIISWNIWEGKYFTGIIDFLKKSDADIIGFQEAVQEKDGKANTAQLIANELGYEFVYATTCEIEKDGRILDRGNAILSKHRIIENKTYVLSEIDKRTAIGADIEVKGTKLHVFNTHLIHTHQKPSGTQNLQAKNLIEVLPKRATILMGDFNAVPGSVAVKKISKVLKNTDTSNLPTWCVYPEGCKVCKPKGVEYKLDYIFVSQDIKCKLFEVGSSKGSDHLPISAIIQI